MSKFNEGDEVLIDRNIVAEIQFYDEDLNIVRYVSRVGGAVNTVTAPIRGGGAPDIVLAPQFQAEHEAVGNPSVDGAASEVTTVTHPQLGSAPAAEKHGLSGDGGAVDLDRLEAASKRTPKVTDQDG